MSRIFSRIDSVIRPAGHVFYGWYIVSAAGGLQLLSGLLWMHSYGAYVVLLQEEFGWSKALVAGAFALTRIESGILGPLQGWLTDITSYYQLPPTTSCSQLLRYLRFIIISYSVLL